MRQKYGNKLDWIFLKVLTNNSFASLSNLSINIGRKNGVTPIELISLLNRVIKSNEIEIGAIDIRESYTIFEIDSQAEKDLIKKVLKVDYNGIDLVIKESKEKVERKFQREKKSPFYWSNSRYRNRWQTWWF